MNQSQKQTLFKNIFVCAEDYKVHFHSNKVKIKFSASEI
jgi:hypothetical protein